MSHRIAVYLAEQITEYDVDCEYNRDGFNPKELHLQVEDVSSADDEAVTVFPDIIVHRRGNNEHNLLVVEMKKKQLRSAAWSMTDKSSVHFGASSATPGPFI